jgi:hypothetical protein
MRKVAAALFFIAALGMLAPPVFAQAPAPAPAPKVTINGLVDFVVTVYSNWSNGPSVAPTGFTGGLAASDVTNERDKGWYARERGVFTITGEVGRTKGVWAVELDFTQGAGQAGNSGNAFNGGTQGFAMNGTSANFDQDIDVASVVETKWLYIETPATGEGSFLPWIPFSSIARVGGQPARGIDYKNGILVSGDIPAIAVQTNWTPDIRSTIMYLWSAAKLDPIIAQGANNNYAWAAALEMDIFKGFTIKPTYAFAWWHGGSCNSSATTATGNAGADGYNPNDCGVPVPASPLTTYRNTVGGDVRWTIGGFSLQPTFYYQFGTGQRYNLAAGQFLSPTLGLPTTTGAAAQFNTLGKSTVDISAFLFDTIVGYRIGPLNLQARLVYASGQPAHSKVGNGADISYYRPVQHAFGYFAGWTDIWTGGIDYAGAAMVGVSGMVLRESPSYDKYGRIIIGFAADYALTPALTFTGLLNGSWTPYKVDTDSVLTSFGLAGCPQVVSAASIAAGFGNCTSNGVGKQQFLGVESALGMTYRFAPNVALDLIGSYLYAGEALNQAGPAGTGANAPAAKGRDAQDIWKFSTRLRFTF